MGQSQTAAEALAPETLAAMQTPGYVAQILEQTWVISIFSPTLTDMEHLQIKIET